jgi:hypothetical protein
MRKIRGRRGSNPVEGSSPPSLNPRTVRTYAIYYGEEISSMMILRDDLLIAGLKLWAAPICKGIVELDRGCIEAISGEDRGTTFTMDLPIAQLEA